MDTIVAQYTPDAAKLGKPPKVRFLNVAKAEFDPNTIHVKIGGFMPKNEWYHCEGCIRHEWGHWAHWNYVRKHPGIVADIQKAGDGDWQNVKSILNGNMGAVSTWIGSNDTFSQELYGSIYFDPARGTNEKYMANCFSDCIAEMSLAKYGGGHDAKYFRKGRQLGGWHVYCESIANVRSMLGLLPRAKVAKYFPSLVAIVERMGIL